MLKILVLSHMYPNNINPIAGIFVHEQVKALKKMGCEVKVLSPVPWTPFPVKIMNKKWNNYSKISNYEKIEDIDVYYPRKITFPKNFLLDKSGIIYFNAIKKIVREIYKDYKFDIIHSHSALPDGYAGMLLKREYNKPLVTTIHGKDFQQTIFKNKKCLKAVLKVLNESDKVITVSKKLENIGIKLCDEYNKFATINNGFNCDKVFNKNSLLKHKYKGKLVLLSVGNLIKTKGHDITIKALKAIDKLNYNFKLLIIGDGVEKENLMNLTNKLQLEDKIEFLGQLSHELVMEYMSICDIFVLPSWKEGFGVVYVEAMAHGKPVIGCKGEGIDGIVVDDKNGILVNPKSIDDLYNALKYLIVNDKVREKIGEEARKSIQKYTWEENARKNIEIYNKLL